MRTAKNIPIPKKKANRKWVDILYTLEVGHSKLVDNIKEANAMRTAAKSLGMKVQQRAEGLLKIRVWRTE